MSQGGRANGSEKRNKSKMRKLSYHKLQDLVKKEPEEILLTLRSSHGGFENTLAEDKVSKDKMALILIAVGKAITCDEQRCIIRAILTTFISSSKLIYGNIQKYLCSLQYDTCDDRHLESLSYLMSILEALHETLRALSSDTLSILLPVFKSTIQKIISKQRSHENSSLKDILHKIEKLENNNDQFIELQISKKENNSAETRSKQLVNPPNDFREIPIFPSDGKFCLNHDPFLRPIIKRGHYESVEHYLDVHFRLLYEDIYRPMIEGIQKYSVSQRKGNMKKVLKDARIYTGVQIQKPVMSSNGLLHLISFENKSFKHIAWENSRRLLFGSLLCLSHDNFQSVFFATVARRDPIKLKDGILEIQFECPEGVFKLNMSTSFVMMETNTYFEAYRHVLTALQKIKQDNFPLKEYIVHGKLDVEPPQYLTAETVYNFQSLLEESSLVNSKPDVSRKDDKANSLVLDTDSWPSKKMKLDEHQLAALKSAITKELAIIQGPPGTGKTFIGLKIVQLLLSNCNVWNPLDSFSPLLIVCYTNHALDQFLEGIVPITNSIIRVGGRSSNPIMHAYQLNTLRTQLRNERKVPGHIFCNINESKLQMKAIQEKVATKEREIEFASNCILTIDSLKDYIKVVHYNSFITAINESVLQACNESTVIQIWLELLSEKCIPIIPDIKSNIDFDDLEGVEGHEEEKKEESDEEYADVEYITNERTVDDVDDFNDHEITDNESTDLQNMQFSDSSMEISWTVKGGYKERKQFIRKQLQSEDVMTLQEAENVKSVWKLAYTNRWRMYRMWKDMYIKDNLNKILQEQKVYKQLSKEYEEVRTQEDINLMCNAKIVGMTTSGAAKYRSILQKIKPPVIIAEEAAEILEAHIITSLTSATKHLILIGDHQQLRPSPAVYELAKKYNLDLSFFERMIKNGMKYSKLLVQHRMRPCISQLLVPHIYKEIYDHPSVQLYEDIKGVEKNVFFVNHLHQESCIEDSKSKHNIHEADFLIGLCKYLLLQGYNTSQITILTMYMGQMSLLKKRTANNIFQGIRVTSVDNFQGEENDIILVSFVRSNDEGSIGFLGVSNRICVALSRAKKGLYCIGNFSLFAESNEMWEKIMTILTKNNLIGTKLKLRCQVHRENSMSIGTGVDFNLKAPEGGCNILCDVRLQCGHACTLSCHPYDREHKNFKCNKPCQKRCKKGHKCSKKCHEECGPCEERISVQIPTCNHCVWIKCCDDPYLVSCNTRCSLPLPCGHICPGICGKPCRSCNQIIKSSALCGHEVDIECSKSDNDWEKLRICKKACNKELECGHLCKGNCGLCCQFRFHIPCTESCKRVLVCGHECKFSCAKNCPPCEMACENRCVHSRCPAKCGQSCSKCNEKCNWRCIHLQCTEICGNKCNRPSCDKPCQKLLKCGHQCIGLCGEPCPRLCRICNESEVTEIMFGTEEEPDAHFIQLEDCMHIFEVSAFTKFMEMQENSKAEIQMKSCPKCRKVIRRNNRFGNVIKTCLKQIEIVKVKVCGLDSNNEEKKRKLLETVNLLKEDIINMKLTLQELTMATECNINTTTIDKIFLTLSHVLSEAEKPHAQSLVCTENYLMFLADLIKICKEYSGWHQHIQNHKEQILMQNLFSFTIKTILQIMDENKSPTEQVLSDINQEVHRLQMFNMIFQLIVKTRHSSVKTEEFLKFYKEAVYKVLTFGPLTNNDLELIKGNITEASKHSGGVVLGISNEERKDIIRAMGLSSGHWFTCPNGHVYCITECGGAMVESVCNECKANIGGSRHQLRGDNRLAREMDGSQFPAWSNQANMQNYVFE